MARRLYRIFAHVFFHHRKVFDPFEAQHHLCARFSMLVLKYQLMEPSMLLVPEDAYLSGMPPAVESDDLSCDEAKRESKEQTIGVTDAEVAQAPRPK